jgi:hypothetical protein
MVGHGKFADDELENALAALKTRAYGGTRSTRRRPGTAGRCGAGRGQDAADAAGHAGHHWRAPRLAAISQG